MATTYQNLIDKTQRYLFSGFREEANQLAAAVNASSLNSLVTLSFVNELKGIQPGSTLSMDNELFYVFSVNASAKTASCVGAYGGSVAAAHVINSFVTVNPRFPPYDVANAVNDELLALSSPSNGLFQVASATLTYNPAIVGYDLTGVNNFIDVQEARWKPPGPSLAYPLIKKWRVFRQAPAGDFPSSNAVLIYDSAAAGRPIYVRCRCGFSPLVSPSDPVSNSGLHAEAFDIPPVGAAIRLIAGREIKRTFTEDQPDTRRAAEVPAGATLKSIAALSDRYERRIREEAARLQRLWPDRRKSL